MRSFASKLPRAFSWRHAKEIYIAALLTLGLKTVLAVAGFDLSTKGFLILGSFSYLFVSLLIWFRNAGIETVKTRMVRPKSPGKETQEILSLLQLKLKTLAGDQPARRVRVTAVVIVTAILCFNIDSPTHEIAVQLQNLVSLMGLTYAVARPVYTALGVAFTDRVTPGNVMLSSIAVVPALVAVVWAIGAYGDNAIRIIVGEPVIVAIYAAAIALVFVVAQLTKFFFSSGAQHAVAASGGMVASGIARIGSVGLPEELTDRDIAYVAAHEAGHLMTMAAFSELPASFKVKVGKTQRIVKGFVSDINTSDSLQERNYWEWRMLKLLAGREGELFAFGTHTLGSSSDHNKWLRIAKNYLGNHEQGVFYDPPSNVVELERNEEQLEALKTKQLKLLHQLFHDNRDTFDRLRGTLADKGTLNRDEAAELLRGVRLPEGFTAPAVDDRAAVLHPNPSLS